MGAESSPDSYLAKWDKRIYTEAFRRLGISLQLDYVTAKRRSLLADEGGVDGDVGRTHGYGAAHPNLVRVEEPIVALNFSLFAAKPALQLLHLDDLRTSNFLVEYRRGIGLCENALNQLVAPERISEVPTEQQAVKKLLAGRTDLYCDIDTAVLGALNSPEFKGSPGLRKVIDLGSMVPIYPYVHKKHVELAPRLAATLKKMKAEGLIEAYRIEVERELGWAR